MTDVATREGDEPKSASVSITVDGTPVSAREGELIIEAAERAGVFIPRFCYHPRMAPVGMCRMCLVEVSGPRGFALQPACYLRVQDDMEVLTASEKAKKAQEGVLEFLLVNHPLDCPVCDKGGECPLQDQAMAHGPGESRFVEEKRHWAKPIEIGPLIHLDRERCIQCARCTRFAEEIAGEALIDFAFRGDQIEVATFPDRPFSSYFSGNTVQICPVGALTSAPYRFKSRPWDLEQVESTCTTCSVGCRVVVQSSAGRLVRYLGVDAEPVNQSWLCDKGRYGYEANTAANRLTTPLVRRGDELEPARWPEALGVVATAARAAHELDPGSIAVIGGARVTNEDAYAWAKLAKGVLGTDSVDAQLDDGLSADLVLGLPRATIAETLSARLVILLAPDLREELPVLFLRLRTEAVHNGLRLLECSSVPTSLAAHAAARVGYLPGEAGRLAAGLVADAPPAELPGTSSDALGHARTLLDDALSQGSGERGEGVVVVLGRPSIAESASSFEAAAGALHGALPGARFLPVLRRSNVNGAIDMGLAPGVLPGRTSLDEGRSSFEEAWGSVPGARGRGTRQILEAAVAGEIAVLFLLGADPLADVPDQRLARQALEAVPTVVALGSHGDASSAAADVVLPIAGADERTGSTTNIEGRVSRVAQKVVPPGTAWPAWTIAAALASELGEGLGFENLESLSAEIGRLAPAYRGIDLDVLGREQARDGLVAPLTEVAVRIGARGPRPIDPIATPGIRAVDEQGAPLTVGEAIPSGGEALAPSAAVLEASTGRPALLSWSQPTPAVEPAARLDSYSLRLVLARSLYDTGTLVAASPSLSVLAEAPNLKLHPTVLARLGLASGERLRLRAPGGDLDVDAFADAGVSPEVALLLGHVGRSDAEPLVGAGAVTDVRLETI